MPSQTPSKNPAPRTAKTVGELAEVVSGSALVGDTGAFVTGVGFDSRLLKAGDLFASLRGADLDGHQFIPQAIANGASALLVENRVEANLPQIVVRDSREALAPLSARFYDQPSHQLQMVGLTGTDGKTTTSYLLDGILQAAGRRTGLIGTISIRIGPEREERLAHQTTPESNLVQRYLCEMVTAGVDTAIIEATSHGLAMHRLDATRFEIAGVTNITHEHLEFHKTIERYRAAKAILVERVASAGGVVVLNYDDNGARSLVQHARGASVVWYSADGADVDLCARELDVRADGSSFVLRAGSDEVHVSLPLIGHFNIANALCAAGTALAAGVGLDDVCAGLESAPGVPGRMDRIGAGQPFVVVVDYAHTPASLRKTLTLLRAFHPDGRLIVVTGSAGERDTSKRPLQGAVCAELADISIFTNEDPRHEDPERIIRDITEGAVAQGGVVGDDILEIPDRRVAIAEAFDRAGPGDCVLLAGKGHESSIILGSAHRPWDEAAVARELLLEAGYTTSVLERQA